MFYFFLFNDTAATEIYPLSLHYALPISLNPTLMFERGWEQYAGTGIYLWAVLTLAGELRRLWRDERAFAEAPALDRKSTRLNSSHANISYAVFCLKKKKKNLTSPCFTIH